MSKTLLRTDYLVYGQGFCDKCLKNHTLTGTGTKKAHVQPLINDVVKDLTFYYDKCDIKEVRGVFAGEQDIFVQIINNKRRISVGEIRDVNKVYMVKKVKQNV